jgi:hypothetical protein
MNEPTPIDFAVVGEPLNTLLIAMGHKLTREWPAKYADVTGAHEMFVIHLRAAHMTYRSGLYVAGDKPPDPGRLTEFCASLPLLNRSIVDMLFTVLFVLEDVPGRSAWYRESDYREASLELKRYTTEYGGLPEWQEYLGHLSVACNMSAYLASLTPAQRANPTTLRSWPNPGAMKDYGVSPRAPLSPVREFMKYLHDFYFVDLSQQAHFGAWGMVKRGAFLLDEIRSSTNTGEVINKYRYYQFAQSVALVLALASEIEVHFEFGLRTDLQYIWAIATPVFEVVKEMHRKRYRDLLA